MHYDPCCICDRPLVKNHRCPEAVLRRIDFAHECDDYCFHHERFEDRTWASRLNEGFEMLDDEDK